MKEHPHICDIIEGWEREQERNGLLRNPPPDSDETGKALARELGKALISPVGKRFGIGVGLRLALHLATGHGPGWETYLIELVWIAVAFRYWAVRVCKYRFGLELTGDWRVRIARQHLLPLFSTSYCWYYLPACALISALRAAGLEHPAVLMRESPIPGLTTYTIICLLLFMISWANLAQRLDEPHTPRRKNFRGKFLYGTEPAEYSRQLCNDHLRAHPPLEETR